MKIIPVIALVLGAAPAWAANAPATEGTLQTREGSEVVAVPLEHTDVKVRIDGFIADVEVDQRFHNPYSHKIEATYLFPLPAQSAVDGYELATGGRTIKGELELKDKAKAVYKAAATKGYVAALLTQERPNLFTQAVANIEPGATVDVKLHYVQALAYDDGAYELVFPMVAGPRFVPKSSKVDATAVQPPVLPAGLRSGHDIGLAVEIDAGVPIRNVRSSSHAIDVASISPHEAKLHINAKDTIPNKDFILRYDVAGEHGPAFAVVPHKQGDTGTFFFMAQPPVHPDAADVTPKEVVFVIDTSSSMQGQPLAKAKEAIARTLKGLHADDTFQIVRFDDTASALGGKLVANKPKNVDKALAWLGQLDAGGGTDMTTGIKAALGFPHDPARLRVVVFLTDGFIGNEDEILAEVQAHIGDARLFSFGVGSAVNRYLLEEMATVGRGTVQIVRPDEDTAQAVARLEKRIASPLLTDVAIDWKGLGVQDVSPAKLPDLFAGQPLVLAGRYAKAGSATVTVSGRLAGRPVTFDVPVTLPDARERPAIAAIWARGKIAELTRKQLRAEQPAIKQQIIDLALANHLMSAYTAFVAVDTSKVTKGGTAQPVAVPVEVPDGLHSTTANFGGSGTGNIYGLEGGVKGGGSYGMAAQVAPSPTYHAALGKSAGDDWGMDKTKDAESQARADEAEPARRDIVTATPAMPPPPVHMAPPADLKPEVMKKAPAKDPGHLAATKQPANDAPDTAIATMRAEIGKCWAATPHGTLHIGLDFDAGGLLTAANVTGGDTAVADCVRAVAIKWRSHAKKHLDLGITK